MQMIAIGGAIGTGLFIGSGSALTTGGSPALSHSAAAKPTNFVPLNANPAVTQTEQTPLNLRTLRDHSRHEHQDSHRPELLHS